MKLKNVWPQPSTHPMCPPPLATTSCACTALAYHMTTTSVSSPHEMFAWLWENHHATFVESILGWGCLHTLRAVMFGGTNMQWCNPWIDCLQMKWGKSSNAAGLSLLVQCHMARVYQTSVHSSSWSISRLLSPGQDRRGFDLNEWAGTGRGLPMGVWHEGHQWTSSLSMKALTEGNVKTPNPSWDWGWELLASPKTLVLLTWFSFWHCLPLGLPGFPLPWAHCTYSVYWLLWADSGGGSSWQAWSVQMDSFQGSAWSRVPQCCSHPIEVTPSDIHHCIARGCPAHGCSRPSMVVSGQTPAPQMPAQLLQSCLQKESSIATKPLLLGTVREARS